MVELKVTITSPDGVSEMYSVRTYAAAAYALHALGSAVELGCALLGARFRKETLDGMVTRTVQ